MNTATSDEDEDDQPTLLERRYALAAVPPPLATWAPRIGGLAIAAAVGAGVASFLPWAYASLNDRGAAILLVTEHGVDASFTGHWVIALALLAVVAAGALVAEPVNRLLPAAVAVLGAGIVVAALAGRGNNASVMHKMSLLRTGTIDELHPVVAGGDRYGLWLTVAAGVLLALTALAWLSVVSAYERRHPRVYDGSRLY